MKHLKIWFNNRSLYNKILLIMSISMIFNYLFFFFNIWFLARQYEKDLYQTNARNLNHVSSVIAGELRSIEDISSRVATDADIQENLYYLNKHSESSRDALYKRNIYQALYPYTFKNDYIKSINIFFTDKDNICMGNSIYIEKFDLSKLKEKSCDSNGNTIWESADAAGIDTVCIRQIRQLKYLGLNKLADLYIVVDMEHLINDALTNAGYSPTDSHFILLENGHRIYPELPYHDELYPKLTSPYSITTINGHKEFIISGTIPDTPWDYLYFRNYDPIFHNIQAAKLKVLLFTTFTVLTALLILWLVFRRILTHLDFLMEKIRNFGNGEPPPIDKYDYTLRQDEIGHLHRSFDEMTKSVKVLRDENYDKQLLLRDATIKQLQQQIDPHFLYNTLDTINWRAQKYGADDISCMVRSLGNLFRTSINGQEDVIPLSDELTVLNSYIQIQRFRFQDRLNFELHMPKDIRHILVPKMCLQPLVENALKHAMEYSDELCNICVTLTELENDYQITVANTGSQFEENLLWKIRNHQITPQGSGVGLVNIDSRMKLLYGNLYGLIFYNQDNMAIVELRIPKERET